MTYYLPAPDSPPGLDPKAWKAVVDAIAREAGRVAAALESGRPVPVGVANRLRVLREVLRSVGAPVDNAALVALNATQQVVQALNVAGRAVEASLPAHALAAAEEVAQFLNAAGFATVVNVRAIEAAAVRVTQNVTADWERLAASTQENIRDAIREGMVAGLNPREVATRVRAGVQDAGGLTYARALTIARTEMADLYDSSRLAQMGSSEYVSAWWWRARPDACAICQIEHGRVFEVEEPPYRHHNCRCVMVPIVGDAPPAGDYMPGEQRPRGRVLERLPVSWRDGAPDDLRSLVETRDNPRWRPSKVLRPPAA